MKTKLFTVVVALLIITSALAYGQMMKRTDAVWARNTTETITLDGKLTEASWATAESLRVQMGKDNGIPGSGWYWENGLTGLSKVTDPTDAWVKFLAKGDTLYVGIVCKDKSIGAGLFNQFDGFLMNLRYRESTGPLPGNPYRNRGNQASEIFYGWVSEGWADTTTAVKGALPAFLGDWGSPYIKNRPDSLKAFWDAATYVQGSTNDDSKADTLWSTEFKFNLKKFNYNVMQTGGDVVMWGVQIYDADYRWPLDTLKASGNRTWLQSPWGNASAYNHLRIFVRSDVTTASGAVPTIGPDFTIPDGKNYATPTIDGKLTEDVWKFAPSIKLQYGNATIRNAYPNTAKYRSGQEQFTVNGAKNTVVDPNTATIKYFYKGDTLYLGFDVTDKFVQGLPLSDRWDGLQVTMNQRDFRNGDSVLQARRFTFRIDSTGKVSREDDLGKAGWDSLAQAVTVALSLNSGTTIDTVGTKADSGYTAEMKINLRKMGYAAGRGDGVAFLGFKMWDGDSPSVGGATGTAVWFMRPGDWDDGSAWFYMDPSAVVTDVADKGSRLPEDFVLLGNYPNPFNPSTQIKFQIARASDVTLEVFDVAGRLVSSKALGMQVPGEHAVTFDASNLASGSYFYRLKNTAGAMLMGKMMLLK